MAEARAECDVAAELRIALIAPSPHIAPQLTAGELLRAIEGFQGQPEHPRLPHVFVHPGELRFAEGKDLDLERAIWTIPPHKTKMRRAHAIPLSRQALAILASIERDADYGSFRFPPFAQGTFTGLLNGLKDPSLRQAIRSKSVPVGRLRASFLSPACRAVGILSPVWRHDLGCAPIDYLARWRMALVTDALASRDRIAAEIGYESASVFSTVFRKRLGCPPGQFA